MAARILALAALLQTGCAAVSNPKGKPNKNPVVQQVTHRGWAFKDVTPEEKRNLQRFFIQYAQASPTARQMLHALADAGTTIEFFDKEQDSNNLFDAGLSDENVLGLNRKMIAKGVSFDDTFFHEGEHVLHLREMLRCGINARSFRSLDDLYTYLNLMEALAYRKAALCRGEYKYHPDFERAKKEADEVFLARLSAETMAVEERQAYEEAAIARANTETNILPNQVYFNSEPNWNQLVSVMSRGEVTQMPILPKPTLSFLTLCIFRELEKNPNAQSLDEFDLSCVLAHQSTLCQDEGAIKKFISSLLIETYDACCNTQHAPMSEKTQQSFLYLSGWPNRQQMESVNQGSLDFVDAMEDNLRQFAVEDLFDAAQELIESKEVQSYATPQTQHYGRLLYFEKQVLCSEGENQRQSKKKHDNFLTIDKKSAILFSK